MGTSSIAGKGPAPLFASYATPKHGLAGFFDSLRIELANSGVAVTVAYPDLVGTEFFANLHTGDGHQAGARSAQVWRVEKMMPAETCERLILRGAALRKREVLTSARGKLLASGMTLAAGIIDRIAKRIVGWDEDG